MRLVKAILIIFSIFICAFVNAQEISVASFRQDIYDLTANMKETTVYDQNGEKCALIKIITTQTGFTFDVGSLGITRTQNEPSQIWVYVPHGVRKISIYHKQLGSLINWPFPETIEPAKTYLMKLTTGKVTTVVQETSIMDYLVMRVIPKNATVYINDEPLENQDGICSKLLAYGTYNYRVELDQYHTATGKVIIDTGKKEVTIELKPAFGHLILKGGDVLEGAELRVDDKKTTFTTNQQLALSSGTHTITLQKEFYRIYKQTITIKDGELTPLIVSMVPNFTFLTINAHPEAEIVINNQTMGTGTWSGKLSSGAYRIVARRPHYRDVLSEMVLTGMQDSRIIDLGNNEPILGNANITSTPPGCIVEIDEKAVGKTPCIINDLLEGTHTIRFSKKNFGTVTKELVISEQKTTECSAILTNSATVKISASPTYSSSEIYLDGQRQYSLNVEKTLNLGQHLLEIKGDDRYIPYSQMIDVASDIDLNIVLEETNAYKKQKASAAKAAERALRQSERTPFPSRFGLNLCNLGGSIGNEYLDGTNIKYNVLVFSTMMFGSFGFSHNAFTLDAGAGYSLQLASPTKESSSTAKSSVLANQFPIFVRVNYNLNHKTTTFITPYLSAEFRNYMTITSGSGTYFSFGIPLKFGLNIGDLIYLDVFYEMCFSPYSYIDSPVTAQPIKYVYGNLGVGFSIVLGDVNKKNRL